MSEHRPESWRDRELHFATLEHSPLRASELDQVSGVLDARATPLLLFCSLSVESSTEHTEIPGNVDF